MQTWILRFLNHPEKERDSGNWNILVPEGIENNLVISLLAESEKETGQTESAHERELEMWWGYMAKLLIQTLLECKTLEGDSPVEESNMLYLKRVGLPELEVWI